MDSETDRFIKDIYEIAAAFATNHIMLTFGSDFQYQNARINFDQMDKLMKYTVAKVKGGGGGPDEHLKLGSDRSVHTTK